jgi:hypothetical protein
VCGSGGARVIGQRGGYPVYVRFRDKSCRIVDWQAIGVDFFAVKAQYRVIRVLCAGRRHVVLARRKRKASFLPEARRGVGKVDGDRLRSRIPIDRLAECPDDPGCVGQPDFRRQASVDGIVAVYV